MTTLTSQYRRIVTLDIETDSLNPLDTKGALEGSTGRIVCICLLVDDGTQVSEVAFIHEDEAQILHGFWGFIKEDDAIVGHNVLGFDLPFILQRSWVHDIRPSRSVNMRKYYTDEVFDTMQVWTNWGKGVKLDSIAHALGCGAKTASGTDVAKWWATRELDKIVAYCMEDVRITYRVFARLMYLTAKKSPAAVEMVLQRATGQAA
jgi:predicted PolB exonuclease-like 3'-5' exonuclease